MNLKRDDTSVITPLVALYGETEGYWTFAQLRAGRERLRLPKHKSGGPLTQRDSILITYADQVQQSEISPLRTLADFCTRYLSDMISGIHLLPFYPYSSDDGFNTAQ